MLKKTPQIIITFLTIILLSGMYSIVSAQQKAKEPKKETFTRPEPTKPIKPTIPTENRYQEDKVFLEHADSLYRPPQDFEEKQIVKGDVRFRQGGIFMYCDSAYYWPTRNSMDAFGHVVMKQGDTLFVYADHLIYDGSTRHAVLVNGPSQREVVMKNRSVTLTTDSLDYDVVQDLGWYNVGGKLVDGVNTLTSHYGQYSPSTKIADFRGDVVLVNRKDGYKLYTEELRYNTNTAVAEINTETLIEGKNDTIITSRGWYNTRTDNATLTARSTILHRDSAGNVITLEGDNLIYDKLKHLSEAYMYKDPNMNPRPMVLTDTARKMMLVGGYGRYNDLLQEAMATDYPLLIEYSRPDTLFLRADTILTFQRTEKVWPDSLAHQWTPETRQRLASYTSIWDMAKDIEITIPLLPSYVRKPGETPLIFGFNGLPLPGPQPTGKYDLKPDTLQKNSSSFEEIPDSNAFGNQEITPGLETEWDIETEDIEENHVDNEVLLEEEETVIGDSLEKIKSRIDQWGRDSIFMIDKNFHAAKAIGKARFFKSDLQGIADTILYHQYDSMLYLQRKPVVWSEERQIFGDTIKVHLIDSVADWAHLPVGGMVIEHIEDDFYNQLAGSEIKALLRDSQLDHLIVNGNVEAIFLPMENDSTYNKIVHAESSYLTVDMDGNDMKKLKMWPEVDGTVTPIFLVTKNDQKYLQGFKWLEMLRPRRRWYGERVTWEDELGDVPDELEEYFNMP
ncbi:MAG: LPS export ABC transporter periplasmic protein LptC [Muribaculaceae bacterium]|nr:LPS export ABC transporter periplasmic protein LptC [Muribaculaceae bacterium]